MQCSRIMTGFNRNYINKFLEIVIAVRLVKKYGKDNILKFYLTAAPFGPQIYGLRFAAKLYFNKPPNDLSWAESSLLAGLPQSPSKFNLFDFKIIF